MDDLIIMERVEEVRLRMTSQGGEVVLFTTPEVNRLSREQVLRILDWLETWLANMPKPVRTGEE